MSVYLFTELFYLLLFLLMCGTLSCGHVYANSATQPSNGLANIVELFKVTEKKITTALKPDGDEQAQEITVKEYYSPVLVSANNVIVALAALNNTDKIDNNITVLSKYVLTKSETNWGEEVVENSGSKWIARFAVYKELSPVNSDRAVVRGLVAAAINENKIYVLLVNASSNSANSELTLEFKLVVGTVTTGDNGKITWVEEKLNNSESQKFTEQIKEQTLTKGAFSGSAIVTEEGKILFLLKARTNVKKTVFGFLYPDGTESAKTLKLLSFDKIAQGCYPQFFLWGKNIIMVPTDCTGGVSDKKVMEIADVTNTDGWIESSEQFSHFVEFFQDKSDFTTARIEKNNKLLLFTQKKSEQSANDDNCDVFLWATNGKHAYNAGRFIDNVNVTSINLLYTKDELLALYQQWESKEPKNIVFKRLKTQLGNIKTVIDAWNNNHKIVKQLCGDKILCAIELPTDGLVGFLRTTINKDADKIWKDEYYYVNATAKNNATKMPNGFTFSGESAGAKWEVGKEEKDQPYNFTDPGFTLLAAVEIGKTNNEKTFDNSLLGLILKEGDKRIGLLCSGGNWAVGDKKQILKKSGEKCEQEETYVVGLVLKKTEKLAIFVDGKKLNDLDNQALNIGEGKNTKHFYFGADAEGASDTQQLAKTDVTITNVLLYNRPIDEDKIKNIRAKKREKPKPPTPPLNGTISTQEDGKNTSETDRTSSTSATPTATEKDGAEMKLCLFSMNGVTVLLSLFFGVFTLLGCSV